MQQQVARRRLSQPGLDLAEQPVAACEERALRREDRREVEAGVFYYRERAAPRGRILSITDKVFPVLIGDGVSKRLLDALTTAGFLFKNRQGAYLRLTVG